MTMTNKEIQALAKSAKRMDAATASETAYLCSEVLRLRARRDRWRTHYESATIAIQKQQDELDAVQAERDCYRAAVEGNKMLIEIEVKP